MENEQLLTDVFLQPWFLPQRNAIRIRGMVPQTHKHKMLFYFEDYGCLKCGKKGVRYGSNAMCKLCVQSVKLKMLFAIKRRWKAKHNGACPPNYWRAAEARQLLADLLPKRTPAKRIGK
jgi:hypothetical protein